MKLLFHSVWNMYTHTHCLTRPNTTTAEHAEFGALDIHVLTLDKRMEPAKTRSGTDSRRGRGTPFGSPLSHFFSCLTGFLGLTAAL